MHDDRPKFKEDLKRWGYRFALDIIAFVERLPKGHVSCVGVTCPQVTLGIGVPVRPSPVSG